MCTEMPVNNRRRVKLRTHFPQPILVIELNRLKIPANKWGDLVLHISHYIHVSEQKSGVVLEILLESWFVGQQLWKKNSRLILIQSYDVLECIDVIRT